jgi:hypothetical protein
VWVPGEVPSLLSGLAVLGHHSSVPEVDKIRTPGTVSHIYSLPGHASTHRMYEWLGLLPIVLGPDPDMEVGKMFTQDGFLRKRLTKLNVYMYMHCTALHCTALHCTALHCTAPHCTALFGVPSAGDG